jgi:pyocin large subunit-like protein
MISSRYSLGMFFLIFAAGCATTTPVDITGAGTQLEVRQIQTREYDSLNKQMTMRSVIATLQDLGFTIDQADQGVRSGKCTHWRTQRAGRRDLPGLFCRA